MVGNCLTTGNDVLARGSDITAGYNANLKADGNVTLAIRKKHHQPEQHQHRQFRQHRHQLRQAVRAGAPYAQDHLKPVRGKLLLIAFRMNLVEKNSEMV